jgi:hypothetical protein
MKWLRRLGLALGSLLALPLAAHLAIGWWARPTVPTLQLDTSG